MTFLAPGAGLFAAAIAVPILLALYLLKLRRRSVRISSTRFWEQAVSELQANVPLRWLKPSWLLLLQLLGLSGLLIAIARPAIPSNVVVRPRTIIVIDHSASMSARDASGEQPDLPITRLDAAKREASLLIEQINSSSAGARPDVMVISLAAEARIVERFTSDPRSLRDAVNAISPTDQPADLEAAARLIQAATVESESSRPTPTAVVLFSDGSLEPADVGLPTSVSIELKSVGPPVDAERPAMPDNVGFVALGARRDADTPSTVRIFARVSNAGSQPAAVVLTCAVDGRQAALLPLTVPPASLSSDRRTVPGEAGATLAIDQPGGGLVTLSIARDDLLLSDNTVGFTLRPVSKPRVLAVGPNDPNDPILSARGDMGVDRFLLGVLSDLQPAELRVVDIASYESAFASLASDAGSVAAGAPPFDIIVFDRVAPVRLPPVPSVHIGLASGIPGLTVTPLEPAEWSDAATRIISWRRSHPLLRHVALDSVLVSPPMRLTILDQPDAGGPSLPSIQPLAFGKGGPLMALVEERGPRAPKRLVLAFDLARTNWGPQVSFPVFFSTAVELLTGRGDAAVGSFFTTSAPVSVLPLRTSTEIKILSPEPDTLPVRAATGDPQPVSLGVPRTVGLYRSEGVEPADEQFAVNLLSPRESALGTSSEVVVGGRTSVAAGSSDASDAKPLREIWKWFVLASLVLLTLEWFLFAFKTKT